jgi:hypothetical protein
MEVAEGRSSSLKWKILEIRVLFLGCNMPYEAMEIFTSLLNAASFVPLWA